VGFGDATTDGDSLTEACERSAELSREEDAVEAELRADFVLATCFGGAFALGATGSGG
jgi:hypothetical protein